MRFWLPPGDPSRVRPGEAQLPPRFDDNASRLVIGWQPEGWGEHERTTLSLFPFSSATTYLGFSQPIRWWRHLAQPATPTRPPGTRLPSHALRADVTRASWDAFVAVKTGSVFVSDPGQELSTWMGLASAGVSFTRALRIDVAVAHAPAPAPSPTPGLLPPPSTDERGLTVRAQYAHRKVVDPVVDQSFHGGDPEFFRMLQRETRRNEELSATVAVEAARRWRDPLQETSLEALAGSEIAAALDARLEVKRVRLHGLVSARSVNFILSENSRLAPPLPGTVARTTSLRPEWFVRAAVDYRIDPVSLTVGAAGRWRLPAHSETIFESGGMSPEYMVLDENGKVSGKGVVHPRISADLFVRWDPLEALGLLGQIGYARDPNFPSMGFDGNGQQLFLEEDSWRGSVVVQARF